MLIGYQGIIGSHCERAARILADNAKMLYAEFVPLISSTDVVKALKDGSIHYGVLAVYNSIGGTVLETVEAFKNFEYKKITAVIMPIHQCMYKVKAYVPNESINRIVSHRQALKQTQKMIKKYFPYAKLVEMEDTALAAKRLAEGEYDKYTAVICSRNAGEYYGLEMMYENIEDDAANSTMFHLIEKA